MACHKISWYLLHVLYLISSGNELTTYVVIRVRDFGVELGKRSRARRLSQVRRGRHALATE